MKENGEIDKKLVMELKLKESIILMKVDSRMENIMVREHSFHFVMEKVSI